MELNNKYFENFELFGNYCSNLNNNFFDIISVNIRSISSVNKFNQFKSIIVKLEQLPNIIAVQETWFQSDLVQIYNIPGYNAVHCCRHDGYGGTSLYIRDNIRFSVESCETKQRIECIRVSLDNFSINGKSLIFTTFYRSPKCNLENFFNFLEHVLLQSSRSPSIFVGDSNIDLSMDNASGDLLNMLHQYDYKSCHCLITRPRSGTSIDNIFSNMQNELLIASIECNLSDHNVISCKLRSNFERNSHKRKIKYKCNFSDLRDTFQERLICMNKTNNVSRETHCLISEFSKSIAETTSTEVEMESIKNLITPWANDNIDALVKLKKNLLKKRRKCRIDACIVERLERISKVIKIADRENMNDYLQSNVESIKDNPKLTWSFLNETLGRNTRPVQQLRNEEGHLILSDRDICMKFNNFFLQIPEEMRMSIQRYPTDDCNNLNSLYVYPENFEFCHTSAEEISEIITELKFNKSCGHDGISSKCIVECKDIIVPHLVEIFNNIVTTSTYPDDLKIAKIVPIPKDSSAHTVEKYRPIALLPIIDKIFEKILHKQLSQFLDQNEMLYKMQFGFRKGSGTQQAVVNVVNYVCECLDDGYGGVVGIFFDLSKAFDLVDHTILKQKLQFYGIRRSALKLFNSYLDSRRQYVEIRNTKSNISTVKTGVPQGSVLGPLLFTLFINDISNLKLYGKLIMYADDLSLFYPYKHEVIVKCQIEHDVELVQEYMRLNRLVLNPDKTKLLRFRPYNIGNDTFCVKVGGIDVNECKSIKYLGVHLQSNLSWNIHIQHVKKKVAPALGLLFKFKNKFDLNTKLLLYNALIHSHFNYMPLIYAHRKTTELKSLQRTQNKALKIVYNLPLMYPTRSLYKDISKSVLPIYGLYKMQLLIYIFKAIHNIGHHTIEFSENQNTFNTRNGSNLIIKRCRLETTKQRIEHAGSSEFNHLPVELKNISRISIFKTRLKSYLIQNIEMLLL